MIGNDVIDLAFQVKLFRAFKSDRLNHKIFTPNELDRLNHDDSLSLLRRWTMKEAAYKAHQRIYQLKPKFNPFQIDTHLIDAQQGTAKIQDHNFNLSSTTSKDSIFSSVDTVQHQINLNYTSDEHLLHQLCLLFDTKSIHVCKDELNIPSFYLNNQVKPISLTKHGKFKWATIYSPNC